MKALCVLSAAWLWLLAPLSGGAATYYVDAAAGRDGDGGTSPESAWKSLSKVNHSRFQPGDEILLRRGARWEEELQVSCSGEEGRPIVFGAYGEGVRPVIDGGGSRNTSITIRDAAFITVEDLQCLGWRQRGIYAQDTRGIILRRCVVSGGDRERPSHGIQVKNRKPEMSTGIRIEDNEIGAIGTGKDDTVFFCGITVQGCRGAVIAGNRVHPVNTAAIRLLRAEAAKNADCLIEGNRISGSYGGLMNFHADGTTIRDNVIRDGAGLGIGIAYDSDRVRVSGNLIYNLSPSEHLWNGIDINHNCKDGRVYSNKVFKVHRHCLMLDAETGVSSGWEFKNNVLDARLNTGSLKLPLGIRTLDPYASDSNLFYSSDGMVATHGELGPGRDGTAYGLEEYRRRSGQDAHSIFAGPLTGGD